MSLAITKLETFTRRFVAVVRVTLEDGTTGIGQMSPYHADLTTDVFHRLVAPEALGEAGDDVAAVVDKVFGAQLKFPGTFLCRAIAGLDTALWDARGKREHLPVYKMLGAATSSVAVYGSSMSRAVRPGEEADRMLSLRDRFGFGAFKFRVGQKNGKNNDAWPGRSRAVAKAVSETFQNGVALLADGNSCYDVETAIETGKMLADHGVVQFEEPCPYWDYDGTRAVCEALPIDVSGGEQDNYLPAWQYMTRSNVVDICQPDVCYVGGILRSLKIARIAEEAGKPVMFHAANASMVTLFSLHVFAALENAGKYTEFSIEAPEFHDPYLRHLFEPALTVSDGHINLGDEPGWGIRIGEKWLDGADYRCVERGDL